MTRLRKALAAFGRATELVTTGGAAPKTSGARLFDTQAPGGRPLALRDRILKLDSEMSYL